MATWCRVLDFLRSRRRLPEDCLRHVGISSDDAFILETLLASVQPRVVLEIGTFVGLSTGVIASALPEECMLVCVDPNLSVQHQKLVGNGSFELTNVEACYDHVEAVLEQVGKRQSTTLLRGFFSTRPAESITKRLLSAGVDVGSIPIVGACCAAFGPFDFVFLDGDHSECAVLSDLEVIARNLSPTGLISVHDLEGDWCEGPQAAITRFLLKYPMFRFECLGNIGILTRVVTLGGLP